MMKIISCLIMLVIFTFAGKNTNLEYTFRVGDQYDWVQTTKQTVKQTLPAIGDVTIDVKVDGAFKLKVLELTTTGARMEIQYSKIKVESSSPMLNVNLDSNGEDDNLQSRIVKSMIGKPFYFHLTRRGVIENVIGLESLLSDVSGFGLDEAAQEKVKKLLEETVGGSSVKASLETGFLTYPGKKIERGETWKTTGEFPLNFPISIANEWN